MQVGQKFKVTNLMTKTIEILELVAIERIRAFSQQDGHYEDKVLVFKNEHEQFTSWDSYGSRFFNLELLVGV